MNDYIELSIQINLLRHKIEQALQKGHFAKANVYWASYKQCWLNLAHGSKPV